MEEIQGRLAEEVVSDAYVELAKYTAHTRNYPNLLDGMKTAYRRLIYQSREFSNLVKCATLVGRMIEIHPHGDESAYSVLVECTCKYNSFPLFDGKGNFGGLGFGPAAMRYPEAKLSDIAKLIYLELIDYAEYVDGEVNNREPLALPALIPYCFLAGCSGFSVGMPTPNFMPLNVMDLINYYIDRLEGKVPNYPSPDYGSVILDCYKSDHSDKVLKDGKGSLWFAPYIIQEDYNRFVVTEVTPNSNMGKVNKKLQWYLDEGYVDFSDETNENGYRFVYTINNFNKISAEELKKIIYDKLKCSVSYRFLVEYKSIVYFCNFDYIINHQLQYLRECVVRKFEDKLQKSNKKSQVLEAIDRIRENDLMSQFKVLKRSGVIDIVTSWGFSKDIASEALTKSIDKLLDDSDNSIDLEKEYKYQEDCKEFINNPDKHLLELYYRLKDMVTDFYGSRQHSVFINDVKISENNKYTLSQDKKILEFGSDKSCSWNSMIYCVTKFGNIQPIMVPKINMTPVELPLLDNEDKFITAVSDICKYVIFIIGNNHIYVIPHNKIRPGINQYIKLWNEDYPVQTAFSYNDEDIKFIDSKDQEVNIHLSDYVKSRISKPQWSGTKNELKYYINEVGDKIEIDYGI